MFMKASKLREKQFCWPFSSTYIAFSGERFCFRLGGGVGNLQPVGWI